MSANHGAQLQWRSDGRELYYVEGSTLMAVSVSSEQGFTLGQSHVLLGSPDLALGGGFGGFDVAADGRRFVMTTPVGDGDEASPPRIRVVQNWYEEFRDREE